MDQRTPSWGIEPVPSRLRVLGLLDLTLLWGNLSVSLLVIVAAAGLGPALSFKQALLAILIRSLPGSILLGLGGAIGADPRVPGMVLLRAPLGRRGSYAPTVLNVAQNLGWSTFELIIISTAAAALSECVFGFEARGVGALLFGGLERLPDLGGDRQGRSARALADEGDGRAFARAGRRPRDRVGHLVDAARRRLPALRARPAPGIHPRPHPPLFAGALRGRA